MSLRIGLDYCKGCGHRVVCGIWHDCMNNELFEEWQSDVVEVQITSCRLHSEGGAKPVQQLFVLAGDEDGEVGHNEDVRRLRKGKQR